MTKDVHSNIIVHCDVIVDGCPKQRHYPLWCHNELPILLINFHVENTYLYITYNRPDYWVNALFL